MYDLGCSVEVVTVPLTDSRPVYTHTSVSFGMSRVSGLVSAIKIGLLSLLKSRIIILKLR